MRIHRLLCVAGLAVVSSCADLSLPTPPPPPGATTLTGRVVVTEAGTGRRLPAKNVFVEVLRTNLSTTTNEDGRFSLSPLPARSGTLSLRLDADGDGRYERQSLKELAVLAGGSTSGDLNAGELVLSENAYVRGPVKLSDQVETDPVHGGVSVFIPGTPFLTQSTDIGQYLLRDVPDGTVNLSAAKVGYLPTGVANVHLDPGQVVDLRLMVLSKDPAMTPGGLSGTVKAESGPASGVAVKLVKAGADATVAANVLGTGTTATDGTWSVTSIPPQLVDLVFSGTGLKDGHLYNALVPSGATFDVGEIFLAQGQSDGSGIGKTGPGLGNNHPPDVMVAAAKAVAGEVVQLNASATTDPDGDAPLKFTWTQDQAPFVDPRPNDSEQAVKTVFTAPGTGGSVKLTLRVTDPLGAYSEVPVVVPVNARPIAQLLSTVVVRPNTVVTVDGTESSDPDNAPQPLSYAWTVVADGSDGGWPVATDGGLTPMVLSSSTTPTVTFLSPPVQYAQARLKLVVSDGELSSAPAEVLIYAAGAGVTVANAGPDQNADFGSTLLLNPAGSTIAPNSYPSYYWSIVSATPCAGGKINGVDSYGRSYDTTNGTATYLAPSAPCEETIQLRVTSSTPDSIDTFNVHVHDVTAPTVDPVGSYPPNGSSGTYAFGPVKVRFQRPVVVTTPQTAMRVTGADGGAIAGTTTYDPADQSVSFVPQYPFDPGVVTTATLSGFASTDGRTIDGGVTVSFSAGPPTLQQLSRAAYQNTPSATKNLFTMNLSSARDRHVYTLNGQGGTSVYRLWSGAWNDVSSNWALDDITPMVNRLRGEEVTGYANGLPFFGRVGGDFTTSYSCPSGNASRQEFLRAEPDPASKSWINWWLPNVDVGKNSSTTQYPGSNCSTARWTSAAIDGDQGLLVAQIAQAASPPDGGNSPELIHVFRCQSCVAPKLAVFPIPFADWVELPQPLSTPATTEVLTGISLDGNKGAYALVWVSESAAGKKLRGATYDPASQTWTAIPGQVGADLNASGDAQYPTVRYWNGDLVIGYFHVEAAVTSIRLLRYSAGASTPWTYLGGAPLNVASPELERLSIAPLQKTLWVGWAEPAGPSHLPHVKWLDPRVNQWAAPGGALSDGTVAVGAGCASGRPFLSLTGDAAGLGVSYAEVCPVTTNPVSLYLRDVR